MSKMHEPLDSRNTAEQHEAPKLIIIGPAASVVLGMPGKGFDGDFGISPEDFEFEPDTNA
jgi:hypothetical protein